MNEFIRERIKENDNLFTKEESTIIESNFTLMKKIYLLGFINASNLQNGNYLQ